MPTKAGKRIWGAVNKVRAKITDDGEVEAEVAAILTKTRKAFKANMDNNFTTPSAIADLQDLTRKVNTLLNDGKSHRGATWAAIDAVYSELGGQVLGIVPEGVVEDGGSAEREAGLIQMLVDMRASARQNRDWAASDKNP